MKTKFLLLTIVGLFVVLFSNGQTIESLLANSVVKGQITLPSTTLEPDSALTTNPILFSDVYPEGSETADLTSEVEDQTIRFFKVSDKGIIKFRFDYLPNGEKPTIKLWNSNAVLIKSIKAKKNLNVINLRPLPNGTYQLILTMNSTDYSWEIIKG